MASGPTDERLYNGSFERNSFVDRKQGLDALTSAKKQQKRAKKNTRRRGGNPHCVDTSISCTTFNILAPIYKRINSENCRESQYREYWLNRNEEILKMLLLERSSIICLQEFWIGNEELVNMYERGLGKEGYEIYKFGRMATRGDGLLTAVRKDHFRVLDHKELRLLDNGDRIAQLLHIQSVIPNVWQETLVVNTHLSFPHNSNLCLVRLRQVYKILEYLENYKAEHKCPPVPVILCGDWNGSKRGHVYKFLRSQGFVSSYDTAHHYTDNDADCHKWVSHRNHRGNICGVDFIWLLNPNNHQKPLKASWNEAVLGIIKTVLWLSSCSKEDCMTSKLHEVGLKDRDAFCFFKPGDRCEDYVTMTGFCQALQQLFFIGHGLSESLGIEEIKDLFLAADTDGNGVMDYEEFQRMFVALPVEQSTLCVLEGKTTISGEWLASVYPGHGNGEMPLANSQHSATTIELGAVFRDEIESKSGAPLVVLEIDSNLQDVDSLQEATVGFDVKNASLHPSEVEQGTWPDDYSLSDHAHLTVVFAPIMIPRK